MTLLRVSRTSALAAAVLVAATVVVRTAAFSTQPAQQSGATIWHRPSLTASRRYPPAHLSPSALFLSSRSRRYDEEEEDDDDLDEDDGENRPYEYARVRSRRGRAYRDEAEVDGGAGSDRSRSRDREYYDDEEEDERGVGGTYGEYDDDYDEFLDDDDDEDFEEGILIPNPVLDSIDPEGAADRIGELISDPRWWRDVAVIAFLCLVAYINTYDIDALIPWDVVTVDDFDIQKMYGPM